MTLTRFQYITLGIALLGAAIITLGEIYHAPGWVIFLGIVAAVGGVCAAGVE